MAEQDLHQVRAAEGGLGPCQAALCDARMCLRCSRSAFRIMPGEIVGFGPGTWCRKTTTLKMLSARCTPLAAAYLGYFSADRERKNDHLRNHATLVMWASVTGSVDIPASTTPPSTRRSHRDEEYKDAGRADYRPIHRITRVLVRNLSLGERNS